MMDNDLPDDRLCCFACHERFTDAEKHVCPQFRTDQSRMKAIKRWLKDPNTKMGPILKIKSWNLRLELNVHDLWCGLFWAGKYEWWLGGPLVVLHVWDDHYYDT